MCTLGHTRSPTAFQENSTLPSLPDNHECAYHKYYRPHRPPQYLHKKRHPIHKAKREYHNESTTLAQAYRRTTQKTLRCREGELRWSDT